MLTRQIFSLAAFSQSKSKFIWFSIFKKACIGRQEFEISKVYKNIRTNNFVLFGTHENRLCMSTKLSKDKLSNDEPAISDEERESLKTLIALLRSKGKEVPTNITEEQFEWLIKHHLSHNAKKKYLQFLSLKEKLSIKDDIEKSHKKEYSKNRYKEKQRNRNQSHINYELLGNTMFLKTEKRTIKNMQNYRVARTMMYGQPLVIDCGFDGVMSFKESHSLAKQLQYTVRCNRKNKEPFNIYLCNSDVNSVSYKFLKKIMSDIFLPDFPINITSESYLDLFPKEKLVYLSPDSDETMTDFCHDAVYIIGGLVDLGPQGPLTNTSAKMNGVKTMKLPLDMYFTFKASKRLGIPIVVAILLELQESGDWQKALRFVPQRLINSYAKPQHSSPMCNPRNESNSNKEE